MLTVGATSSLLSRPTTAAAAAAAAAAGGSAEAAPSDGRTIVGEQLVPSHSLLLQTRTTQ